jgi:hypothetical protein
MSKSIEIAVTLLNGDKVIETYGYELDVELGLEHANKIADALLDALWIDFNLNIQK